MAEENNKFVLYDYLLYFWRKKLYFLIFPLIGALLGSTLAFVFKNDQPYTGQALVFTGSVNSKELTNPANIESSFSKGIPGIHIYVSEKGQVKFTLAGDSATSIKQQLDTVVSEYEQKLKGNYQKRLNVSTHHIETLEKRVTALENAKSIYERKLESNNLAPDQYDDISELIIETEREITKALDRAHSMRSDLVFFEEPRVLSDAAVTRAKSYIPQGAAVGVILGLLAALAFLMLLKYIQDARKALGDSKGR